MARAFSNKPQQCFQMNLCLLSYFEAVRNECIDILESYFNFQNMHSCSHSYIFQCLCLGKYLDGKQKTEERLTDNNTQASET